MELTEAKQILTKQEEVLKFTSFTNDDALKLGLLLVERAKQNSLKLAIEIKAANGQILFLHALEGTALTNQNWMERKMNAVTGTGMSSLMLGLDCSLQKKTLADKGFESNTTAAVGGAFPIKLENAGLFAIAAVSGLPHYEDHKFLTNTIAEYLGKEIPQIDSVTL